VEIKISKGNKEGGVVIGNAFDKYGSSNPLVKSLMGGFDRELNRLVRKVDPRDLHEIGCGEGYWVIRWHREGIRARGSDFSTQVIEIAKENAIKNDTPQNLFTIKSIYNLEKVADCAELIICCEVLEHLEDPDAALRNLQKVVSNYLIISVPREPIWRILNMLRAKYLTKLGNTPGHIQHWSRKKIVELVANYFDIVHVAAPFPWTMILCRNKKNH
jgi:2-polyprenyl-3-methyl-5-hydroxy-6-metoxy-1,4-benzoquinol methylase